MKMEKKKIYIIFIYLSLFLGFIFSILIPLYQVPDEETHINNLYSYLGYNIEFNEENNEYGDTIRIIRDYDEKVDLENYVDLNKKLNIINNIKKIDIHIIRYLP